MWKTYIWRCYENSEDAIVCKNMDGFWIASVVACSQTRHFRKITRSSPPKDCFYSPTWLSSRETQ